MAPEENDKEDSSTESKEAPPQPESEEQPKNSVEEKEKEEPKPTENDVNDDEKMETSEVDSGEASAPKVVVSVSSFYIVNLTLGSTMII